MRRPLLLVLLALLVLAGVPLLPAVMAQEEEERSAFVRFVEERISSPTMQIRLNGLEGALSSDVRFSSITISDPQGVWLTIENPRMVWSRAALLRGRLDIESLTADSIEYARNPVDDESLPSPEAASFALPDLPVAVILERLSVPRVVFGEPVFGLAATASVEGRLTLDDGSLDTDLSIRRTDGPGGFLRATANYDREAQTLALDVRLEEPENGVIANLLDLEGRPPVTLAIVGNAPISDLDVDLALDVAGERILTGDLVLDRTGEGLEARADLGGPLGTLLPARQRAFFGQTSRIEARAIFREGGAISLPRLQIDSGAVSLAASAELLADLFLTSLELDASLAAPGGGRLELPAGDGGLFVDSAQASVRYDAQARDGWQARLAVDSLATPRVRLPAVEITANGTVSNPADPTARALTFDLTGNAAGIETDDPALGAAIGRRIDLDGSGFWRSGDPLTLRRLQVGSESFFATLSGELEQLAFDGRLELQASDLEAFSELAGRDLGGSASLVAAGEVKPLTGAFDLAVEGQTRDLEIGDRRADALLAGETRLAGGIARTPDGLSFEELTVSNPQLEARIDGAFASDSSDLAANARIADLSALEPDAAGALSLDVSLRGAQRPYEARAVISLPQGTLAGRAVRELVLRFDGNVDAGDVEGRLSGAGSIGGEPVSLSGRLALAGETAAVEELDARIGGTSLAGRLARGEAGLYDGELEIDGRDIGALAALAFTKASGAVEGRLSLRPEGGGQSARASLRVSDFAAPGLTLDSASIEASAADLLGQPRIDAQLSATGASAGGVSVRSANAQANSSGDVTLFDLSAELVRNDATLAASGRAEPLDGGMRVTLESLRLDSAAADARLSGPAVVELRDSSARIAGATLNVGGGSVRISGLAGDALALDIALERLPLAIANAFQPQLGLGGTVSGTIDVTGTASDPAAAFRLSGEGVTARQLSEVGVQPVGFTANGRYGDGAISLEAASLRSAQQLSAEISGTIPLRGGQMNVTARGSAPLAIAEPLLAERGTTLSGQANFDITASGTLAQPRLSGILSVSDATLADPLSNLRLTNIGMMAGLEGDRISISRAQARLAGGGTVSASGTVGTSGNLPADLSIRLQDARYADGQTFSTTASGNLRLTGGLASDPLLSGTVNLGKTEIAVPEHLGGAANLLDVRHVAPSPPVARTLERLEAARPRRGDDSRPVALRLDVTINAANQIFVRGRGLDAELGGQLRVTGPVSDVEPVGRFELRRGRLSVLGQRFELTEGSVTLSGDLDPLLDFTATTRTSEVEARIRLSGRPSDPQVSFSSSPELPQDEVLAQIIFGRSVSDLSALQVARLANAVAGLAGGRGVSLVDRIRRGAGIDDLDLVEDDEGQAAVRAGKYVSDNVYLGVQAGATTETTINLDLTDNVKARGSVSTEGDTGVGIFFEKDF